MNINIYKVFKYITNYQYRFIIDSGRGKYDDMPDEQYLEKRFSYLMGYPLNLENPKTFNEKIQWLKLYDRKPLYTMLVDKYEAKECVKKIIGEQYIIPGLGVWDNFDDIDFSTLPKQFVLKCTHDSGGLIICRDKEKLCIDKARKKIKNCLAVNYYWRGREWPYKDVKPRIIAEKYIENKAEKGLIDYKFFCFNGNPLLLYISRGLENHSMAEISFYDMNGKEKNFHRIDYKPYHNAVIPDNFEQMKNIASMLAREIGSPFVRVDLYSLENKIYFSEITFHPCSGMIPFDSLSADIELGNMLFLPKL